MCRCSPALAENESVDVLQSGKEGVDLRCTVPYRTVGCRFYRSIIHRNHERETEATEEERGRCVCMAKRQSPGTEGKSSKQDTDAAPSLAGSRAVVHAVIDGGLTGLMVLSEIES